MVDIVGSLVGRHSLHEPKTNCIFVQDAVARHPRYADTGRVRITTLVL